MRHHFNIILQLILLFFSQVATFAQEQKVADSLVKIYKSNKFLSSSEKLELLRNLCFNEVNDIRLAIQYADELITLSKKERNYLYLHRGYMQKGNKYRIRGDLNTALDALFKSKEAATQAKYFVGEGSSYSAIADVYSVMGNAKNAEIYYKKAISILRVHDNGISLGAALLNAGDEYFKNKKYDIALQYFEESGSIFKKVNYLTGTAYNLGNIGMVYAEQGIDNLAMKNIAECIKILELQKDYYAISD